MEGGGAPEAGFGVTGKVAVERRARSGKGKEGAQEARFEGEGAEVLHGVVDLALAWDHE
jgi:hypothetical protein